MTTHQPLLFGLGSAVINHDVLVRLSKSDMAYRQSCIDKELEFSESFLKETRAQRLGCSVRDLECMLNYERNRHLADEAIVMRLTSWETDRAPYIDWDTINKRASIQQQELADDFAAFRQERRQSLAGTSSKQRRAK